DDGVFFPTDQFEMMMNRRHGKDAAAGQFKTQHLQNHRDRFDHENTAHHHQEQFLLTTDRDHTDHAADGERSGIAHKNFCRIAVKPKKSKAGANQRRADNRQLAGEWIKRNLQVFRDAKISGRIRKQGIGKRYRHGASDSEAVQAVGQIDRVGRSNNNERKKQEGKPSHVRDDRRFEKWQVKRTRLHLEQRTGKKDGGDDDRENDLEKQFKSATDAGRFFLRNLQVIICKSDRTQRKHAEQSEPDET